MTEQQGIYRDNDGNPLSSRNNPTASATKLVFNAINTFNWRSDYLKFCQTLGLEPGDYADQKWSEFQELVSYLNSFDVDSLTTIVEAGNQT
jgi:hypothetical protein